jgi:hypothetical protein
MERDRYRHSKSHRGPRDRRPVVLVATIVVGVFLLAGLGAGVVALAGDDGSTAGTAVAGVSETCAPVDVTTSSSFQPVLRDVAASLRQGGSCVDVRINVADGRAASGTLTETGADVWIPDDAAWAGIAPEGLLAPDADGRPDVIATSPIYMVTDSATAQRIRSAGGTWRGLVHLLAPGTGVRMVVRDPAGSGDGMVAAGGVGEAVWNAQGMDASALALATAFEVTRTQTGSSPAIPTAKGDVALVPEYALLRFGVPDGGVVLSGSDNTPSMRFSWWPTAAGASHGDRAPAVQRLHDALVGDIGGAAMERAGLRGPDGVASGRSAMLPPATAKPFDVLGPHHVEHVFATWYPEARRTDLLVVVDVSGSMGKAAPGTSTPLIDLVRSGVTHVGKLLPGDSRLGVWEFGSRLDGASDHKVVLPTGDLTQAQRGALGRATEALQAQRTGTGLYDTILAAYQSAAAAHREGVLDQVLVFTDGRNEDDPGSITAEQLAQKLAALKNPQRPVALSVIAFGDAPEVSVVEKALAPIDGYVESLHSAAQVPAVFVHVAAGGPHG